MHTVFINTSTKKLNDYNVLFDIHTETRKLVSFQCPLSDWYSAERGYKNCVLQLGDLIDAYAELNNSFNLIVYIDLAENPIYSSIKRDVFTSLESSTCLLALRKLYSHIVSDTITEELIKTGREPHSTLVMFGEDTPIKVENVAELTPSDEDVISKFLSLIGFPSEDEIAEVLKTLPLNGSQDNISLFQKSILPKWGSSLIPDVTTHYEADFALWYDQIICEDSISDANRAFYNRIMHRNIKLPETVSCACDYHTRINKSVDSLNQLNILLYLLNCVENESIHENNDVRQFVFYSCEEISSLLKRKEAVFSGKIAEIESLSLSYAQQKLAPEILAFDHKKFGLDEFGDKACDILLRDNSSEEDSIDGRTKKLEIVDCDIVSLFSADNLLSFDFANECEDPDVSVKTTAEEHIDYGIKIRKMHNDFLKQFKVYTSETLSNYSGKSKSNKPALLQVGEYRYATEDKKVEKKSLETVEQIADKAYSSTLSRYMEFCAGRPVSMTDISDYCDIYVSRINQIKSSLMRTKLIALLSYIALILMYIPFFAIEGAPILKNAFSLVSYLVSFLIPCVILGVVYTKAIFAQRKKYLEARRALKVKSDEIISANKQVATEYFHLLSSAIPSLRWVYEYKLDIEYCAECCEIADAKLAHHKSKLYERVSAINNILSDLECSPDDFAVGKIESASAIDYNLPFCSGTVNISFYKITDKDFFKQKN